MDLIVTLADCHGFDDLKNAYNLLREYWVTGIHVEIIKSSFNQSNSQHNVNTSWRPGKKKLPFFSNSVFHVNDFKT